MECVVVSYTYHMMQPKFLTQVLRNTRWTNVVPYDNELGDSLKVIADAFQCTTSSPADLFEEQFLYGKQMLLWRKGNLKPVKAFIDNDINHFLWVTTKSKAFLIDLTYAKIERFDYEITQSIPTKYYFKLRYFQEQIPFVYDDALQCNNHIKVFQQFIRHCIITYRYSPMLSKILKSFKMSKAEQKTSVKLTIALITDFLQSLKIQTKDSAKKILALIYARNNGSRQLSKQSQFTMQEVFMLFQLLQCSSKVKSIFQHYSKVVLKDQLQYLTPYMNKEHFIRFLQEVQEEQKDKLHYIMQNSPDKISFFQFCTHLYSIHSNSALLKIKADSSHPLTDYYCYSSHNTYLTGNQLTSDASVNRYVEDLSIGVKCVEIDLWEDGGNLLVRHAFKHKGFGKPISFEDTIREINNYSNAHANHEPIILSLENHASDENKYQVQGILQKYFGSKLVIEACKCTRREQMSRFKKLSQLRNRIIIKTDSTLDSILGTVSRITTKVKTKKSVIAMGMEDWSGGLEREAEFRRFVAEMEERNVRFREGMSSVEMAMGEPMLKVAGIFKTKWQMDNSCGYECNSLTNEEVQKIMRGDSAGKLVQYTKRSWLRTYPVGTEISSGNYNIRPMLQAGAQIIALNTQTKDINAWMAYAYFTAGHHDNLHESGYVLKPEYLRENGKKGNEGIRRYEIKILSDFKIEYRFYGSESDDALNEGNKIQGFRVRHYEEAFVIFNIEDRYKACLPLRFVRPGIRSIVGRDEEFYDTGIRMLVEIRITQQL